MGAKKIRKDAKWLKTPRIARKRAERPIALNAVGGTNETQNAARQKIISTKKLLQKPSGSKRHELLEGLEQKAI